jgi:hypothetical protein
MEVALFTDMLVPGIEMRETTPAGSMMLQCRYSPRRRAQRKVSQLIRLHYWQPGKRIETEMWIGFSHTTSVIYMVYSWY